MKKFYKKISDLMFDSKYSNLIWEFILPSVLILMVMMAIVLSLYKLIEVENNRHLQTKYEFVTQDGEVKEGYGCKTQYGKPTCTGDDGSL